MSIFNWWHHLFNPHCPECKEEREESEICDSCEILKLEIERLRNENDKLLNRILREPEPEKTIDTRDLKPIKRSSSIAWNIRRQMLEAEDREKAKIIRDMELNQAQKSQSVEEIEKELGVISSKDLNGTDAS